MMSNLLRSQAGCQHWYRSDLSLTDAARHGIQSSRAILPGRPAAKPKGDRVVYWQKLAHAELEQFAGREHPDTIRMLEDLARQWQVNEPTAP